MGAEQISGRGDASDTLAALRASLGIEDVRLGVGASAGMVVGLVAALLEEIARSSGDGWPEAGGAIAQATALRRRSLRLARADAAAYAEGRDALLSLSTRGPTEEGDVPGLTEALNRAAEVPLQIAEAATDAVTLAALIAERAKYDLRADAAGAACLASGATAAATHLVEVNLATQAPDERLGRARELVSLSRAASERALAASA